MASELPRLLDTASKFALFLVSGLKDEKLIKKKQIYMKTDKCKLYSRVFWIYLQNFIKIDPYNIELYRFNFVSKLVHFLRHSRGNWNKNKRQYTRASLKSTFSGLQYCCRHYGSISIHLAIVAFQNREITWNSDEIWPYSSSRSSKVIDLGVNRKLLCNFLLVINSNYGRYRFRDIHA